jgi:O-antigen ligase
MFILVYYFLTRKLPLWARILSIASIVYLLFVIVLLSSKMFIFIFYMSGLVIAFYSYRHQRKIKPGLAVVFILLFALPILSTKFSFVSSRITETKLQEYRGTIDDQNGLAVRGVLWKSSWNLILQRPILGWGRFGGQEGLRQLVAEAGFEEGAKKNYNSHNQYLYAWLCYGLPGILFFVGMLVTYLVIFIRKKQYFGIYLVSSFMVAIITECMMETQRGIVFFFLFTTIFLYHFHPRTTDAVTT